MFSFLRGRRSKDELKNRLEMVIAYDRAQIPPGKVDALRKDLLEVVQRYFPTQGSNVEIEQRGDTVVLVANIPLGGREK
ncbi:cell division topological specificity factor MinE [Deinococcus sp. KNUC1210]|uniref:cell division topological specificity factor MinE n=1 Tax=unclassified Deinococcus TaxID=2623546 RepID=UPI001EF144B8|nr:cell division topological specificity factor MinE [Deinococcus sp. KNUC1210]ULH16543.1 cell division topological specificity factor MinE [Deinococcus sp. KNUC1210]